jgi:hypothetical protein
MRDTVERGESVLRASIASGIFTPVVLQMVAVGEESGAVDDMMEEVGDMYQREVEYELKTLGQQIEPILIVCSGSGADSGAGHLPADVGSRQGGAQAMKRGSTQWICGAACGECHAVQLGDCVTSWHYFCHIAGWCRMAVKQFLSRINERNG